MAALQPQEHSKVIDEWVIWTIKWNGCLGCEESSQGQNHLPKCWMLACYKIINNKIIGRHGFHFIFPFQKLREELNAGKEKKKQSISSKGGWVCGSTWLPSNWYQWFISHFSAESKRQKREVWKHWHRPKVFSTISGVQTGAVTNQTFQSTETRSHWSWRRDIWLKLISCVCSVIKNLRVSPGITAEIKLMDNLRFFIQFVWGEEKEAEPVF